MNVSAHALIVVFLFVFLFLILFLILLFLILLFLILILILFITMGHDAPIHLLALEETLVHRQHLIVLEISSQRENARSPR